MGLDISVQTDNDEWLSQKRPDDYFEKYSLSRTFCNLMFRMDDMHYGGGESELHQICRFTGVDISPIEKMRTYPDEEDLEFRLNEAGSDTEQQELLAQDAAAKAALAGNLPDVLATVQQLLERLAIVNNLSELLDAQGQDTLGYDYYFTDFLIDKGRGYIDNNFGQDMRNLYRFLKFAQNKGTTSVWFSIG